MLGFYKNPSRPDYTRKGGPFSSNHIRLGETLTRNRVHYVFDFHNTDL